MWALVEFAFHHVLHVDLDSIGNTRSWRWFAARMSVLLTVPNPLQAHFAPPHTEEPVDGS